MRPTLHTPYRDLPRVIGARRLLSNGTLGAELVRLADAAAAMDRQDAAQLAPPRTPERPMPTPAWLILEAAR